jgi:hypothetical protein
MTVSYHLRPCREFLVVLCAFFFVFSSYSQITSEYKRYKELYPNSHSIRLSQESTLTIGLDDGKFKITQDFSEEDIYLDDGAKNNAKQSLSFSTFYDLESIEASSYVIEGDQYQEFSVSDFKEKDDLDNAFYDDLKSINFIFPRLSTGTKTKLKYEQTIKNPRFLNAHYFGSFYPIKNNKFTIIADKDINLRFKEFNTDSIPIKFSKSQNRKSNIYTWELKDMDEFKYESRSPTYKSILPHIIPIISSYKYNGETIDVGNDVSNLYSWYYSLTKNINKEKTSDELIQIVNDLTKNKKNELEKVKAIYYWVQENIKYIAFEYALGGFVPREANEVFNKKYGDCKDNTSLLFKMLEIAGIKGNLAWIGTRSIPYSYSDVPTPSVDNHMILYYENQGKSYYLDATGRYNPLEVPTSFIQGKEALVSIGRDSFMLKKVPVIKSQKSVYKDFATIKLNGNDLTGTSKAEMTGYTKINFFYNLEKQDSKDKIRDYYKWFFEKGNNSFLITEFAETNRFDYDKDFIVDYGFNVSNYAKTIGDEIYINLNLNKGMALLKTDDDREMPLEHKYLDSFDFQNTFIIPEGYKVDYLPENIDISNEYISSSIRYELVDSQIIYKHHIDHNSLILDINTQKKVNDLIKKIEQGYKEVVVLKKI